ncbi:hypothetical protein D3C73_1661230 [compost metagenome]
MYGNAEALIIGIHSRMQDAYIRTDPNQMQLGNRPFTQLQLQIGTAEGAVTSFVHPID